MSSTFLGLNIAYSGLSSANNKLNVTSNNIANINTPGYNRQQVVSRASNPLLVNAPYGAVGTGVTDLSIDRITDAYYVSKFNDNHTKLSDSETLDYYNKIIEQYCSSEDGFSKVYSDMLNSLQDITITNGSESAKSQFISSSMAFADFFNELYYNLNSLQTDIDYELDQSVSKVNSIMSEITNINRNIATTGASNKNCNELKDKRDALVKELSSYIDITVRENGNYFSLNLKDGTHLIDNEDYNPLSFNKEEKCIELNTNKLNLRNGKLSALLRMRNGDGKNNNYHGVEFHKAQVNDFVKALTKKINETLSSSITSENLSGMNLFTQMNFSQINSSNNSTEINLGEIDLGKGKIVVNEELINNPNLLATKKDMSIGNGNTDVMKDIEKIMTDKDVFSFKNTSGDKFINVILSDITLHTNNSSFNVDLYTNIEQMINNRITSISGVDSDEEALNLAKYREAYNLSAKAMSVMNEVYDRLINYVGV